MAQLTPLSPILLFALFIHTWNVAVPLFKVFERDVQWLAGQKSKETHHETKRHEQQINRKKRLIFLHLAHFSHAAVLSPSDYTRLAALKIISLESCSLIKLYDGRWCRKPHVSWIQRVPEKIQYWGKNTTWQWWLHQRVLRMTFHTELWVQRVCLHLPIKHGLACIFNHVEQSTVYESDRKAEQLQW